MTTTRDTIRKFQFLREIASGGFGSVFLTKVIHADGFSRLVAVKLLHKRWTENTEIASRMRDEARLLGWLRHRNIVEVLDLTTIDGRSAIIMEYLEAIDTRSMVDRSAANGSELPLPVVLEVGAACASALDAAYNRPPYAGEKPLRVIHRDIKPSNLMVDSHGIVKVLDFGVARAEFDSREAKTAELSFGSLEYMPPERLFFEPESPASDIYSLGSTLYEMLALEKLGKAKLRQSEQDRFVTERLAALAARRTIEPPDVARELEELLRRMLAFDESDRPTASDLVGQLRGLSRRSSEPTMEDWAGKHVLALVDEVRAQHDQGQEAGTLIGHVVAEDAPSGKEGLGLRGEEETTGIQTELFQAYDSDGPESAEYTTSTGHDDARWSALKEATLASLNETGELRKATTQPPPSSSTPAGARGARTPPPTKPPAAPGMVVGGRGAGVPAGSLDWLDEPTDIPTMVPSAPKVDRSRSGRSAAPKPGGGEPTIETPRATPPPGSGAPAAAAPKKKGELFPGSEDETVLAPPPAAPPGTRPPGPGGKRQPRTLPPEALRAPVVANEARSRADGASGPRPQAAAAAPRRASESAPPAPERGEEAGGGSAMGVIAGVAVLGLVAIGTFLVVVLGGSLAVVWFTERAPEAPVERPVLVEAPPAEPVPVPVPVPEPAPAEEPAPAPTAPSPEPAAAQGLVFVSKMPDTRKMTVRCDTGSGSGTDTVRIAEAATECTVVAIDTARQRRTAVVEHVEPRAYECFAVDESCR